MNHQTLSDSQESLDDLHKSVKVGFGVAGDNFQYCKLTNTNTKFRNKFDNNEHFIQGVVVTQRGELEKNDNLKKEACKCLLKIDNPVEEGAEPYKFSSSAAPKYYSESLKDKKRKADGIDQVSPYINCDFILGLYTVVDMI